MKNIQRATIATFLFMVTMTPVSWSQEVSKAVELLRYFPEGEYRLLTNNDFSQVSQEEAYPLFKWMSTKFSEVGGGRFSFQRSPLPKALQDKEISFTTAFLENVSIKEITVKQPENRRETFRQFRELRQKHPGFYGIDSRGEADDDGNLTLSIRINEGGRLYVLRYEDVNSFVEEALKEGLITLSGKKINKLPVYAFENESRRTGTSKHFAYATPFNELLLAPKIPLLRKMVAAAEGAEPNLLENPRYVDLIDIVPEMGQSWNIIYARLDEEGNIETQSRSGRLTGRRLSQREEDLESTPIFRAMTLIVGTDVKQVNIEIYTSEEYAEQGMNKARQSFGRANQNETLQNMLALRKEKTETSRDGKWVYRTLTYDRDFIKKTADLQEDLRNEMEERRAEWQKRREENQKSKTKDQDK